MSKITALKCDKCKRIIDNGEIIGIKVETGLFENARFIFDLKELQKCELHVCQNCMKTYIDNPIAYLKGKDRQQWEVKRQELGKLLRFEMVRDRQNKR